MFALTMTFAGHSLCVVLLRPSFGRRGCCSGILCQESVLVALPRLWVALAEDVLTGESSYKEISYGLLSISV